MRINNQRELLIGTTTRTANGGVLQVSNGITFPATQSACTDPNTLDDYEEGTWTPSLGGTATYNIQTGTYVKIGRQVTVYCALRSNSIGTGSTTTISGLPFTCVDVNAGVAIGYYDGSASTCYGLRAIITSGSTIIVRAITGTSTAQDAGVGDFFATNARIYLEATYQV